MESGCAEHEDVNIFKPLSCVSRCGPLLVGPGPGVRPLLLPQHRAHPALAQQTDGPGDGLTNTFPHTRTLQRSQETPPAQQTHAHGRLLGHALVPGRRTLGLSRGRGAGGGGARGTSGKHAVDRRVLRSTLQLWGLGDRGGGLRDFRFHEDPTKSLALPVIYISIFFFISNICLLPAWTSFEEFLRRHCHFGNKEPLSRSFASQATRDNKWHSQAGHFLSSDAKALCVQCPTDTESQLMVRKGGSPSERRKGSLSHTSGVRTGGKSPERTAVLRLGSSRQALH